MLGFLSPLADKCLKDLLFVFILQRGELFTLTGTSVRNGPNELTDMVTQIYPNWRSVNNILEFCNVTMSYALIVHFLAASALWFFEPVLHCYFSWLETERPHNKIYHGWFFSILCFIMPPKYFYKDWCWFHRAGESLDTYSLCTSTKYDLVA